MKRSVLTFAADQRPFHMTFLSDADEITLEPPAKAKNPNFANRNELNRNPGLNYRIQSSMDLADLPMIASHPIMIKKSQIG